MKIRRILCIAAVFCLLWSAAAADGYAYGAPVNIMQQSAIPYHWDVQVRDNGSEMTWRTGNLFDGDRRSSMEHVCWNNESLDEIPELTLYFGSATIKDLWIRNEFDSTDEKYIQHARPYRIDVAVWIGYEETPRGPYIFRLDDAWDSTLLNAECIDGYRCLSLPQRFENVRQVDIFIKGWHKGDDAYRSTRYNMHISDLAFLPDTLVNLYGPWIYDGSYSGGNYMTPVPTLVPTMIPTAVPTAQPIITAAPFTGLQVMTKERLSTRSGPGTTYTETGSYLQNGARVKAVSSAYDKENGIWWVQVELTYDGELRRVYTGVKRLQMSADQVPVEEAPESEAALTRSVYGYWGPGIGYAMYGDKIPAGTTGTVWQREGVYAQFEFYDEAAKLYRRVWVPDSALEDSFG